MFFIDDSCTTRVLPGKAHSEQVLLDPKLSLLLADYGKKSKASKGLVA